MILRNKLLSSSAYSIRLTAAGPSHAHCYKNKRCVSIFLDKIYDKGRRLDVAIIANDDKYTRYTYDDIVTKTNKLVSQLSKLSVINDTSTIGSYHKGEVNYVVSMLACWKLNKTFVPLSQNHSATELTYFIKDSGMKILLHSLSNSDDDPTFHSINKDKQAMPLSIPNMLTLCDNDANTNTYTSTPSSGAGDSDGALILYTSGTTGQPKGVIHSRSSMHHMVSGLCSYWQYSNSDCILHFLPLYHLHGVLNKLLCMLYAGGTVEFSTPNTTSIWKRLAASSSSSNSSSNNISSTHKKLTLFMGVPTIYAKMLEEASKVMNNHTGNTSLSSTDISMAVNTIRGMRFNACGSAALPDKIMVDWEKLTGQTLLERYGMTELGMVLSNPYEPVGNRVIGAVGYPVSSHIDCRLIDEHEYVIHDLDIPGELRVKSPSMFTRYINKDKATAESFDGNGYFKTGDMGVRVMTLSGEIVYKLLGRLSSDIIKSAGYKLSALEIERELLSHYQIKEAVVLGVKDDVLGEKVIAVITLRDDKSSCSDSSNALKHQTDWTKDNKHALQSPDEYREHNLKIVRSYLSDKLASYKQPREVIVLPASANIPRNHLGKVNKKTFLSDINIDV